VEVENDMPTPVLEATKVSNSLKIDALGLVTLLGVEAMR
jgi:hypothetical protein